MDAFLIAIIAVFLCFIIFSILMKRKVSAFDKQIKLLNDIANSLTKQNIDLSQKNISLNTISDELADKNKDLSIYKNALNADKEALHRLDQANIKIINILQEAKTESENIILKANKAADALTIEVENNLKEVVKQTTLIRSDNKRIMQDSRAKSEQLQSDALRQSNLIIHSAKKHAEEIAGDAYKALNEAENYESIAKAMKNVIAGYGDEYLIPVYTILDDLANDFSYDDAGINLKDARVRTRLMMKNRTTAVCDYVENNRKETAINFVTDAFNGKVDTILSEVKRDNFGTLEQKVKDAYFLVNNLGKAFRNAQITGEYLNSRLAELKWAVIVNELKMKEREEQRRIKDQIREEERARKELEKAIRDTEKEEDLIKKAIEKAQSSVLKANDDQKIKYEKLLSELEEKLKIAEEKNQRAISMAQQTRSGHVYIISNIGSFGENVFKIGMTRRLEPTERVKELGDASVPFSFDIHSMIFSDDAPKLETELHKFFVRAQVNKVNPRKEFFNIPLSDIKKVIDSMNINAKWTMSAKALEYKESLAIEKKLMSNKNNAEDWIKTQITKEDIISNKEG